MKALLQQPSKRIEYIDALRGFTMILVVFSHVEWFTFELRSSLINELFISFRMPLFFFISGFIGYKANIEWDKHTWWMMSKKKMLIQIIPTLVFGLTYTCLYLKVDPYMFVSNHTKMGYWFTIVLCEIFLLVYTMNYALHQCNSKEGRLTKLISITTLTGLLFIARLIPTILPECQNAFDILSLHQTIKYFPFFAFGYICSMYKEIFNRFINNKNMVTLVIIMFVTLFYAKFSYLTPNVVENSRIIFIVEIIIEMIIGILGVIIVYNTFKTYADSFDSNKKLGKVLQNIGKRTLDIYLLHFFFLPYIPQIGHFLTQSNNTTLELLLGLGFSLMIIAVCMTVSCVLRTSPILGQYLFGAKR